MDKSVFALTVNALTDAENSTQINNESPSTAKYDYEQARRDYNKWLETITEYQAHEAAFDIVENLTRTAYIYAFAEGFKAGIKLMCETLS